jgi:2-keto-4-pentenoate hydratase
MPQNNESTLRNLAAALELAEATKTPIELITKTNPDLTEDDAYAIQAINLAKKLAAGRRVVGQKVGLTSKAMQEQFGVDQPDHGVLTEEMLITAPAKIDLSRLIAPRIEAELSFRLL